MTLQRRTPLRAKPRGKGNRGEREIVDMQRARGWKEARRNWQSGGQGGGDIINGPVGVHQEVKFCERADVWKWLRQAESEARPTDIPMVICRRARMQWWTVMPADELDALLELTAARTHTLFRRKLAIPLWALLEDVQGRVSHGEIPVLVFTRDGQSVYAAAPADVVFDLLAERELA